MKKAQPSETQSRKKKRARDEEEARYKGTLDDWIKSNKEEVVKATHDIGAAKDYFDI